MARVAQSAVCTHTLSMLFYTVTHSTTAHRPNPFILEGVDLCIMDKRS